MRLHQDNRFWAVLAAFTLLIQAVALWELLGAPWSIGERDVRLLAIMLATVVVTIVLVARGRWLTREFQVAGDRLRMALDAAHAVAWDWDVKSGRDVFIGDLKTMFGIDADSRVGRVEDFRQLVHKDDRERVFRAVADARATRARYNATFRLVWADGTIRWVTARGRFDYSAGGDAVRMLGVATDVTDRQAIEAKLRDSQEQLNGIVHSAMDAIIAIDEASHITVFNSAAERIFGCSATDAVGTPIERFIPARFRPDHAAHVERFAASGLTRRAIGRPAHLRALRADGTEFPIEASVSQTSVAGRKILTVVLRDETERVAADEALRESEQRFRLIADSAPVLLWISGTDKLCTYFNRAWLEFTGRPIEAELGNGWVESVHPDDVAECVRTYQQAFDRRLTFNTIYRLRRHDGEYRWILDSGVPRFTPDGTFTGYAGSAIDVTTQKMAQTALADLNARLIEAHESERRRIARELHDDLGQRMAVLTIELDTLVRALPLPIGDLRARIHTVSDQSLQLARDLQAISHSLHSSQLDYLGIVSAASSFCAEMSNRHGIVIPFMHREVPEDLARDTALCLFRVLQEAVTNAVRHAGVERVNVSLRGSADDIRLEVVDAGRGFDLAAASGGRGLGLVSMRERLALVRGELSIVSRPGSGTTVTARVPLPRAGQQPAAALA